MIHTHTQVGYTHAGSQQPPEATWRRESTNKSACAGAVGSGLLTVFCMLSDVFRASSWRLASGGCLPGFTRELLLAVILPPFGPA